MDTIRGLAQMEQIGDKILSTLAAKLPMRLAALQQFWTAADLARESTGSAVIDLDAPWEYVFGDKELISETPTIVVNPLRTDFLRPEGGKPKAYRTSGFHPETNAFHVEAYVADYQDERTVRKLVRYGLAITEILQENSTLDDLVKEGAVTDVDYGYGKSKDETRLFRIISIPVIYGNLTDTV